MNMATIQDVAREAGVSTATVSRILSNSTNVLPETRERVLGVIEKLNYHPNRLARQFRTQETGLILVLIPELGNTFYNKILSGIEQATSEKGYHVMIAETHNDASLEEYFLECLKQKQVDGIITFSAMLPPARLEALASSFPVVVACRYYEGIELPNVTIDNCKASCDITNYLLNLGHREICCLAGNTDILIYHDRQNGYRKAMAERGIEVLPSMVRESTPSIQGGYDAVMNMVSSGMKFTAITACGDTIAIGAIQALQDLGYRVPQDVAVTGFDDIELSVLFSPKLTTVRQPKKQIGVKSVEKLLDRIAGSHLVSEQEILDYELVIRESTGQFIG